MPGASLPFCLRPALVTAVGASLGKPEIPCLESLSISSANSCVRKPNAKNVQQFKMAEVHGNRTHRAHLPVNTIGFEVQASHRARFTSARRRDCSRTRKREDKETANLIISGRGANRIAAATRIAVVSS